MKKLCLILFLVLPFFLIGQEYCIPTITNGTSVGDYLNAVILEDQNGSVIFNNTSGPSSSPFYELYNTSTYTLNASANYVLSIQNGTYSRNYFTAWIDYNGDGAFDNESEKLGEFRSTSALQWNTINFNVPLFVTTNTVHLRIRCQFYSIVDACVSTTYGETEDYLVTFPSFVQNNNLNFYEFNIDPYLSFENFALADFNNDGYADILTGSSDYIGDYCMCGPESYCIISNGSTSQITAGSHSSFFVEYITGNTSIGDINNDNAPDILIAGQGALEESCVCEDYPGLYEKVYSISKWVVNSTASHWQTIESERYIYSTFEISCGFEDLNNDGLQDVVIDSNVYQNNNGRLTNIYTNISEFSPIGKNESDTIIGDFDNDGAADYFYNGTFYYNSSSYTTQINAPSNINYSISGDTITFSWQAPTSEFELTYNVNIGFSEQGSEVVSALSDLETGKRKKYSAGNAGYETNYKLINYPKNIQLYFRVQAINEYNISSEFSSPQVLKAQVFTPDYLFTDSYTESGDVVLFDIDNDDDLDVIRSGYNYQHVKGYYWGDAYLAATVVSENNTTNYDTLTIGRGYVNGEIEAGDFNNDGFIDFIILGDQKVSGSDINEGGILGWFYAPNPNIEMYMNTQDTSLFTPLPFGDSVYLGDISSGDLDNDGDIDILMVGLENHNQNVKLYWNENGVFTQTTHNFPNIKNGAIDFCDLDKDSDLDIILTGELNGTCPLYIFLNKGNLEFEQRYYSSNGLKRSKIASSDLNGDKLIDFVICGNDANDNPFTKVFKNLGDLNFEEVSTSLKDIGGSPSKGYYLEIDTTKASIDIGDFNNDGYPDIFINGEGNNKTVHLYRNLGDFIFENTNYYFHQANSSTAEFGDIDNDGDLDIICNANTGYEYYSASETNFYYKNTLNTYGQQLVAVENTFAEKDSFDIVLTWDELESVNSIPITYNIKVSTHKGSCNIVSPLSNLESGYRRVPSIGNTGYNNSWILKNLPIGTYYWAVQGIDNAFNGGPWSEIDSFEVTDIVPEFEFSTVCHNTPTTFNNLSVASDSITSWHWNFGDGSTDTTQNPTHQYDTAGTYQATLWAKTLSNDSASVTHDVIALPAPDADFSVAAVCNGSLSNLQNKSVWVDTLIQTWKWYFGNGEESTERNSVSNVYNESATASLAINYKNGCSDSINREVQIIEIPQAVITLKGSYTTSFCEGEKTVLHSLHTNGKYKYLWRHEGIIRGGENKDSLLISSPMPNGNYSLEIIDTSNMAMCNGLSEPVIISIEKLPDAMSIYPLTDTLHICANDTTTLTTTYNPLLKYNWIVNGLSTGDSLNTINTSREGWHLVRFAKLNSECYQTSNNRVYIDTLSVPSGQSISIAKNTICKGDSTQLSFNGSATLDMFWLYNNTEQSSDTSSTLYAHKSGEYKLRLINKNNCSAFSSNTITLTTFDTLITPIISHNGALKFCDGEQVSLIMEGSAPKYYWLNNGSRTSFSEDSSQITVRSTGSYSLVTVSDENCQSKPSNTLSVNVDPVTTKPVILNIKGTAGICQGETDSIYIDENKKFDSYLWLKNNSPILNETKPFLIVNSGDDYILRVKDDNKCTSLSNKIKITVIDMPPKPIIQNTQTNYCPGETIELYTQNINPIYSLQWFKDGDELYGASKPILKDTAEAARYTIRASHLHCDSISEAFVIDMKTTLPIPELTVFGPNIWYLGCNLLNDSYTYQWYKDGELKPFNPYRNFYMANKDYGTYTVKVNDGISDCWVESLPREVPDYDNHKSAGGISFPTKMDVYPNPSDGKISVEVFSAYTGNLSLKVYDVRGSLIKDEEYFKDELKLNIPIDLSKAPGLYHVVVSYEALVESKVVVVE